MRTVVCSWSWGFFFGGEHVNLLTKKEAKVRLRISLATLNRHLATGKIPYVKLGTRVLIRDSVLEQLISESERNAQSGQSR